ncbi:uncharacterized [Tachysurus ichikawai]
MGSENAAAETCEAASSDSSHVTVSSTYIDISSAVFVGRQCAVTDASETCKAMALPPGASSSRANQAGVKRQRAMEGL